MDEKCKKRCGGALLLALALSAALGTALPAHAADRESMTLVPVGETVGVKLFARGVMVVGLSEDKSAAKDAGLKEGDILLAINDADIGSTEELTALLQRSGGDEVTLTLRRGARTMEVSAMPEKSGSVYCLGAWVRDSMAGIGTMTYYDPQTQRFAALGHGITDVDTGKLMPLERGSVMPSSVKAVRRGESGSPGELRGTFDVDGDFGTLSANTERGVFGTLASTDALMLREPMAVAKRGEVKAGKASILANVEGDAVGEYGIEIERVLDEKSGVRNLLLRVTDERLLSKTGGIVQGMSGSPIIQNGKLVGAVTHVLVDDPARGYGIFIENMLDAAG